MKFILPAIRPDGSRLHLLNLDTEYQPWVICWNYDNASDSWDWGTYSNNLKEALSIFIKKCDDHDFDDVFEGYTDKKYIERDMQ